MLVNHTVSYALAAAITSIGAPVGLLLLRAAAGEVSSVPAELFSNRVTYGYVLLASAAVFTLFGYALGRQADALQRLSRLDPLTTMPNRRALEEHLHQEWTRVGRDRAPLSVLVVDLDGLKRINDTRGHAAGDRVICSVAAAITETLRGSDFAARWGGDEFVVLAPNTTAEAAHRLAHRIVSQAAGRRSGDVADGTVSIGIATLDPSTDPESVNAELLIQKADRALYEAKAIGRGQVKAG